MALFPSYNLKIENYMDLLTFDLSLEVMLQDGEVLGTYLPRWNRSSIPANIHITSFNMLSINLHVEFKVCACDDLDSIY